jgi:acetyl-CoA carboxylase carboxyltransferase component
MRDGRQTAGPSPVDPSERFPVLASRVDARSEQFAQNRDANLASLTKLDAALAKSRAGGGPKYNDRHTEAGKLLPRERVDRLLDEGSYFLEIAALAGHEVSGHATGASVVGGIGVVSGVECLITASEATVKGGAMSELSVVKSGRLSDIAEANGLPSVSLIESAGADLPNQSKIFVPGGRGFRDLTRRSEARTPTVCLVFGSSTAGGAYIPGMSDYVVMVKKQAQVYLGGPPLVKMATGEETTHEELGGAEMHSRVSGVSDYLAENELDAIRLGREIVAHLNWKKAGPPPRPRVEEPKYSSEDLLGIASADVRIPFDAREIIARIVDGSRFSEFKPLYGPELVCGWAHVHGHPVGILANNGILFTACANKGAQFIQLCNQSNIPIVFLQNIVGFMVGRKYEEEGHHQGGRQDDQRRVEQHRARDHDHDRRELRRGKLRDGGPRVRAALRLQLAQPPHRRDGRQAARRRARHHPARGGRQEGRDRRRDEALGDEADGRGPGRDGERSVLRERPRLGRRDHRSPRHPQRARHRALRLAHAAGGRHHALGRLPPLVVRAFGAAGGSTPRNPIAPSHQTSNAITRAGHEERDPQAPGREPR